MNITELAAALRDNGVTSQVIFLSDADLAEWVDLLQEHLTAARNIRLLRRSSPSYRSLAAQAPEVAS